MKLYIFNFLVIPSWLLFGHHRRLSGLLLFRDRAYFSNFLLQVPKIKQLINYLESVCYFCFYSCFCIGVLAIQDLLAVGQL